MGRKLDFWGPLYPGGDPVPGDPDGIAELRLRLGGVSTSIRSQGEVMRRLDISDWDSDAAAAFREHQEPLPPDLDLVAERYEKVATQLQLWEATLPELQSDMDDACQAAFDAKTDLSAAERAMYELRGSGDEEAYERAQQRYDTAQTEYDAAQTKADDILADYLHDAGLVADEIRKACDDELANEWWQSALDTVGEWLGGASVIGLAGIFCPPLGLVGGAFGAGSLGIRWALEGEGPDAWDIFASIPFGLGALGRTASAVRTGTGMFGQMGRRIADKRRELGELRRPSRRRITRGNRLQQRRDRLSKEWKAYNSRYSSISAEIENLERAKWDEAMKSVLEDHRQWVREGMDPENLRKHVHDYWHPWSANDPAWRKRLGAIGATVNAINDGATLGQLGGVDPSQVGGDVIDRRQPDPELCPTPGPAPSPTPRLPHPAPRTPEPRPGPSPTLPD